MTVFPEWKTRKTIRLWGMLKPDGHIMIDSEFQNEDDAWRIALGFPDKEEIDQAKKNGFRAVKVTIVM